MEGESVMSETSTEKREGVAKIRSWRVIVALAYKRLPW